MTSQSFNYRGWCPSNDYQVHEVTGPALRKRSDRPRPKKGHHVVFRTDLEEPVAAEAEATPVVPVAEAETETCSTEGTVNAFKSVDQKADAFIKLEHRRIQLARLRSLSLA